MHLQKNSSFPYFLIMLFVLPVVLLACAQQKKPGTSPAYLDERSQQAVSEMVDAMGGQKAYDAIHHLQWTFFGNRKWWWDKKTGDVRCESLKSKLSIILNTNSKEGKVLIDGAIQTDPDTLTKYLTLGYGWWINDSYWLVMPFKLQDPGVRLKYVGQRRTVQDSALADVLELTFEHVGITPSNKYHLYVDPDSHLLVQWDYFREASDTEPRFQLPWTDYRAHGGVLFSQDRGGRKLDDIRVYKELPASLYTDISIPASRILNEL